jgi:8-oxo-dGTP pyrophosphatase MutT (NUDIX family)
MPSLDEIRAALAARRPETVSGGSLRRAAVALVLRGEPARPELLFIERAERAGDPWSGHMAFPGGRLEPGDLGIHRAAERETLEEVGLDLAAAERIGRLDDLHGHHVAGVPRLVVSAFVYHLQRPPQLVLNHEVREALWLPLGELCDPLRAVRHPVPRAGSLLYPGIRVGEAGRHVVWGLTYRFLEDFFRLVGRALPRHTEAAAG